MRTTLVAVTLGVLTVAPAAFGQHYPWDRHMTRAEQRTQCLDQCNRTDTTCAALPETTREQCTQLRTQCLQRCDQQFPPAPGEAPAAGIVQVGAGGQPVAPPAAPAPRRGRIVRIRRR